MHKPSHYPLWTLFLSLACLGMVPSPAAARSTAQEAPQAPLKVVATLGVLADLARQVGGEFIAVEVLASPGEDPHFVEPTPLLMQQVRRADVLIENGLQLELWGEKIAAGSGNPKIQKGQVGRVNASKGVATLELPQVLSREWGDVHPYGNPHIWLDPINTKIMAANIEAALASLDPAHAKRFEARLKAFGERLDEALFGAELVQQIGGKKLTRLARGGRLDEYLERKQLGALLGGWLGKARLLKGRPLVTYHKTFIYLAERFGFRVPIEIEEKPGIAPSARHRDRVLQLMEREGVHTVLQAVYNDQTAGRYLAHKTSARLVAVSIDVDAAQAGSDYFAMMDELLERVLASEFRGD